MPKAVKKVLKKVVKETVKYVKPKNKKSKPSVDRKLLPVQSAPLARPYSGEVYPDDRPVVKKRGRPSKKMINESIPSPIPKKRVITIQEEPIMQRRPMKTIQPVVGDKPKRQPTEKQLAHRQRFAEMSRARAAARKQKM